MTELRTTDGRLVRTLETADITAITAEGWKAPEVFTAKGRDGKTDIWGIISDRPTLTRRGRTPSSNISMPDREAPTLRKTSFLTTGT